MGMNSRVGLLPRPAPQIDPTSSLDSLSGERVISILEADHTVTTREYCLGREIGLNDRADLIAVVAGHSSDLSG